MEVGDFGSGGSDVGTASAAAAEAARQAAEAAARAAAEAAARAAAEAAAKAAAEAAAKSAAEAAAKASQANVGRLDAKNFELDKPDFDRLAAPVQKPADAAAERLANAADKAADDPRAAARLQALAKDVKPIENGDAKKELTSIQDGLKTAQTAEDVQALQTRSNVLRGQLAASPNPDPAIVEKANLTHTEVCQTRLAVAQIQAVGAQLTGDPHVAANATAQLLAGNPDLTHAIGQLKSLQGSPLFVAVKNDLATIATKATPEALTGQLLADPDLSHYAAGFAANIARLENSGNQMLQDGLNTVGNHLLDQPGGLSAAAAKSEPDLVALVAGAANANPATRQQLEAQVHGWVQQSLNDNLADKNNKNFKQGLEQFTADMTDLAKKSGLGSLVADEAGKALSDGANKKLIEDTANKGKSIWDHIEDVAGSIGHFATDIAADIGHGIGTGLNLVGTAAQNVMHVAGEIESKSLHIQGELLGGALDAVGLHGASHFVEQAADQAGDLTQQFADGAGDGFKGMASGVGFMVEHPGATAKAFGAMIKHPELIGKAAESMWAEASKGGYAHAAGFVAANLLPMLLTGGGAGVVEGGAELTTTVAARGALEVTAEAAARGVLESGTSAAAKAVTEGAVTEASGGLLRSAGGVAIKQIKGSFTDIRDVAANTKALGSDLKAMPRAILDDAKGAVDAFKNGRVREGINALHDNSLIAAGKDAYKIVKDTKSFVTDTVGIVTDPLKLVEGKLKGILDKNMVKIIKPLEGNASTKLMRDEMVAHMSEMLPV